jgi:hypothetical protein
MVALRFLIRALHTANSVTSAWLLYFLRSPSFYHYFQPVGSIGADNQFKKGGGREGGGLPGGLANLGCPCPLHEEVQNIMYRYRHFVQTLEYLIELILSLLYRCHCCLHSLLRIRIQDLGFGAFLTARS